MLHDAFTLGPLSDVSKVFAQTHLTQHPKVGPTPEFILDKSDPISEATIVGTGNAPAISGWRPVVQIMFVDARVRADLESRREVSW